MTFLGPKFGASCIIGALGYVSYISTSVLHASTRTSALRQQKPIWVVVKIIVLFWVLSIIRHLVFRGPNRGP